MLISKTSYILLFFLCRSSDTTRHYNTSCYTREDIVSVSLKTGLGSYINLWNISASNTTLDKLSMLVAKDTKIDDFTGIIKIKLKDGQAIESNHVTDDFSVQGSGILYLPLKKDPILETLIAENITLHGHFVNSCLHGPTFGIAQWWKYPLELDANSEKEYIDDNPLYKVLNFVGYYHFGKLIGPAWKPAYSLESIPIGYYYSYFGNTPDAKNNRNQENRFFELRYLVYSHQHHNKDAFVIFN